MLSGDLVVLLIDVARLEVGIGHLYVFCSLDTLDDLLNESYLILSLDPLKSTDEVLIAFPRPYLPETLKVVQPLVFVTEYV